MSKLLTVLLLGSLSAYWYITVAMVCAVPLTYAVTGYDTRFPLSEIAMLETIHEAAELWESTTGRELLSPAATGTPSDILIQFKFDDRQERILAEETLRQALGEKEATTEALTAAYDTLVQDYNTRQAAYEAAVKEYEAAVDRFNDRVSSTPDPSTTESDRMKAEADRLDQELRRLNTEADALRQLAADINELSAEGNALIRQYNQNVGEYNRRFADSTEFTQGEYGSGDITIFSFADATELKTVVAHEFGHAFGIGHVEGSSSVMYYLLEDQPVPLELSGTDLEAFTQVCGAPDSFSTRARTLINSII